MAKRARLTIKKGVRPRNFTLTDHKPTHGTTRNEEFRTQTVTNTYIKPRIHIQLRSKLCLNFSTRQSTNNFITKPGQNTKPLHNKRQPQPPHGGGGGGGGQGNTEFCKPILHSFLNFPLSWTTLMNKQTHILNMQDNVISVVKRFFKIGVLSKLCIWIT